jgi:hypothetical protein
MKITLFLPDSTHETLAGVARSAGIEISQLCSNLLTDFAADSRRTGFSQNKEHSTNGKFIHIIKKQDDSKPDKAIPEMRLVEEIVMFLRKKGGSAEKVVVEEAIFEKNKAEFSKSYWQAPVGGDVPRWRKNTQFARNTAKKMELVKLPEDSGRGVWELTERGWKWKFE